MGVKEAEDHTLWHQCQAPAVFKIGQSMEWPDHFGHGIEPKRTFTRWVRGMSQATVPSQQ